MKMTRSDKILGWCLAVLLWGALLLVIWPRGPSIDEVKGRATRATLSVYQRVLADFRNDCGFFPSNADGLKALLHGPSGTQGWNGPYLDADRIAPDYWGNTLQYSLTNGVPVLRSAGADGTFGTQDDIVATPKDSDRDRDAPRGAPLPHH